MLRKDKHDEHKIIMTPNQAHFFFRLSPSTK